MSLPKQSMGIPVVKVSRADPRTKERVVTCIVSRRPYLLQLGPAVTAPIRPPSVNMEVTTENWVVFIGIQSGKEPASEDCRRLLLLQVRTSCGALSSA